MPVPTALFTNRLSACFAARSLKNSETPLSAAEIYVLMKALKKSKHVLRAARLPLVEVHTSDGTDVRIRL